MTDPEPLGRRHPDDVPTPDEIASLLQVEHLLDQRWPETKLEPSTARISALMEMLGSPQRSYPSIHIAGTNGKTSVARMVDALFTAFSRRTGRTTSPHLQAAVEKELAGIAGKLDNDGFLAKAPADVIEKIRARQQLAHEEVDRITARLASLK